MADSQNPPGRASRRPAVAFALALALLLGTGRTTAGPESSTDPLIPFSTLLGGSGGEWEGCIAMGPDGILWIAARSGSVDFPGAARRKAALWPNDIVVLRFDTASRRILSHVWLGGDGVPVAFAFDAAGTAFLAGTALSSDFPVTAGVPAPPPPSTPGAREDAFLVRLSPAGTGTAWSARIGGSDYEGAGGLAVSPEGDPIVVGRTYSRDFPLASPIQGTLRGDSDAFVTRIRGDGTGLVFSTYLGGQASDGLHALVVLPGGDILGAGTTTSADFPATERLFGTLGNYEGFLVDIDAAGTGVQRAALLGDTTPLGALLEPSGRVLLWGATADEGFPVPADRFDQGFFVRLDSADWSVVRAVLPDVGYPIAVSRGTDGTLWLSSSWAGAVPGAARPYEAGAWDAYSAAFSGDDLSMIYGTYLGGGKGDYGFAMAVAQDGSAWFLGTTGSPDFPLVQPIQSGSPDGSDTVQLLFLTHLLAGDPARRPATPTNLEAETLDDGTVRLTWDAGSSDETGFAVYRHGYDSLAAIVYDPGGVDRIAVAPAGSREWVDASAVSNRHYTWTVQAINDAGGSEPSNVAEIDLPPTLEASIDRGDYWIQPRRNGFTFRLRGHMAANGPSPDDAIDPRSGGFEWAAPRHSWMDRVPTADRRIIPPDDPGWRTVESGIRWMGGGLRLDFDPATGDYDLRVRSKDLEFETYDIPGPMQFTVGHRSGWVAPDWRDVGRSRSPGSGTRHFRIP